MRIYAHDRCMCSGHQSSLGIFYPILQKSAIPPPYRSCTFSTVHVISTFCTKVSAYSFLTALVSGITPNGLSNISAVPQATIKSILNGESQNPGTVTIKKLCDGFEITLGEFFYAPEFDALEQEIC